MKCRTKETFHCFHFKSKDDLRNLEEFLGSNYVVKSLVYPSGSISERQYKITSEGPTPTERIINHNDWILLWTLGIQAIVTDAQFKLEYDIIRVRKTK